MVSFGRKIVYNGSIKPLGLVKLQKFPGFRERIL